MEWQILIRKFQEAKIKQNYVLIRDRLIDGIDADMFYIDPIAQIKQLQREGFNNVRVFSLDSGEELSHKALINSADCWLYYLCCKT